MSLTDQNLAEIWAVDVDTSVLGMFLGKSSSNRKASLYILF